MSARRETEDEAHGKYEIATTALATVTSRLRRPVATSRRNGVNTTMPMASPIQNRIAAGHTSTGDSVPVDANGTTKATAATAEPKSACARSTMMSRSDPRLASKRIQGDVSQ